MTSSLDIRIVGILATSWFLQGCGGTTSSEPRETPRSPGDESTAQPGTGNAGTNGSNPRTEGPPPDLTRCPAVEPALGDACEPGGIVCTYGDDVRIDCRHARKCAGGVWIQDESREDCRPAPGGYCPSAVPSGACTPVSYDGQVIDSNGQAVCAYPDGTTCVCNLCETEGCEGPAWDCASPPITVDCPSSAPNLGAACSTPGVACDYGFPCQGGGSFVCKGTVWYPLPSACF